MEKLFNDEELNSEQKKHRSESERFEWEAFDRLGQLIADGEHLEPGGKWITRDYRKLMLKLNPDIKKAIDKQKQDKRDRIDASIASLIVKFKCKVKNCNGQLYQKTRGSKIVYCANCGARFKAVKEKK